MAGLVLLIDDDKLPMQFYVKAMEQKGFEVKQCYEPDSAIAFMEKKASGIDAIILDIMLPPGKRYGKKKDTHEGLITGVFLLEELREEDHYPDTPVIVLTNVKNPDTLNEFRNKPLVKVAQKMDYPPFELAELVEKLVETETKVDS